MTANLVLAAAPARAAAAGGPVRDPLRGVPAAAAAFAGQAPTPEDKARFFGPAR